MQTVYGVLADQHTIAWQRDIRQGQQRPELCIRAWASPASEYRVAQTGPIRVDQDHDHRWVGEVIHLENLHGQIWAVAEVDDNVGPAVPVRVGTELRHVEHPMFWSVERSSFPNDIVIRSVALTPATARIAARPVRFRPGPAHLAAYTSSDSFERDLLTRANEAKLTRHGGPIVIAGADAHRVAQQRLASPEPGMIEIRSAPEVVDVAEERRVIELLVAPYEAEAVVAHHGRMITEVFTRGAFDGIEQQGNRIRVNRDHDRTRTVGRAIRFDPHDNEGLYAEIKIANTELGDETLALAAEDCLDASAGFGVPHGGEVWENGQRRRRITKAFLDHIALTPDPAYVDARVLAVRAGMLH